VTSIIAEWQNRLVGDRYQIQSWIGAGGMQNVFRAFDTVFERPVALKIPKDVSGNRRFQESAILSARVNVTSVAKTLDYIEEGGRCFLIEEVVDGFDLDTVLKKYLPYLPPSTCARIFHQLALSLSASHAVGVIHRDLKPSNIMVVGGIKFDEIKVTDFGIATLAKSEIGAWAGEGAVGPTNSSTVAGAIPYMAPESIRSFKTSDRPSDVWAIAAITYHLLSGKFPFGGGIESVAKILSGETPVKPSLINPIQFRTLGEEILDVVNQCLVQDPNIRPKASELVSLCEKLCYSIDSYEIGEVRTHHSTTVSFIKGERRPDLMCHKQSFYGEYRRSVGQKIWFGRHPGAGNDRAFPVVSLLDELPA